MDYLSQLYESVKDKHQQISLHIDVLLAKQLHIRVFSIEIRGISKN